MTLCQAIEDARKYRELLAFLKVTSLPDAKASIDGLRQRVRYTESFESIQFKLHEVSQPSYQASQPSYTDEEFPAHDFQPAHPGAHPHCTRCHVPLHSSESKWLDGRCIKRTFR